MGKENLPNQMMTGRPRTEAFPIRNCPPETLTSRVFRLLCGVPQIHTQELRQWGLFGSNATRSSSERSRRRVPLERGWHFRNAPGHSRPGRRHFTKQDNYGTPRRPGSPITFRINRSAQRRGRRDGSLRAYQGSLDRVTSAGGRRRFISRITRMPNSSQL